MDQPNDEERQHHVLRQLEQLGSFARDLSYLTRLEVLIVVGGLTLAALIAVLVAVVAVLLRWLF